MAGAADRGDLRHRIGEQILVGQILVGELVDEGGIGAVLQQPPDQIGEQVAMAADRRVDAGMIALLADQALVEPLAHAVQPLELEVAASPAHSSRVATVSALWVAKAG